MLQNLEMMKKKPKILLVDDKEKNLFSLNAILKPIGAGIDTAKSGREAIAKALRNEYAVILLDVQMPELDGFDTAKIIKANVSSSNVPIIFVTAFSMTEENIFSGYESGAVDYICKPINHTILESKIKVFLDLYKAQRKMQESNTALTKINHDLLEFARIVSHDLKEPLRGISSYAQLINIKMKNKLDVDSAGKIAKIIKLTESMNNLISDLFQYTQISTTNEKKVEVDINVLVNEVVESLHSMIEQKQANIIIQPEIPKLLGYKIKIGEVYRNLITNALKYNDKKSIEIKIGYEKNISKGKCYFVKDNGIGIPEKYQQNIFQIFRRLHPKDKFGGGTGVGLSIVKKIIELHNADIWINSKEGEGTTFYFALDN